MTAAAPTTLAELAAPWEQRLAQLVADLDVPGAVLGVSHAGERLVLAAGVAGLRNPAPVTAGTVFQLGSISKLYTATLLLAVAGESILARSVAELVPETSAWLEPEVRVHHLLTHSSGLGGDHFADTGRGDAALARYVAGLAGLPRDVPSPPGERYSYCNSGFAVLGRLVEVLTGETFDAALRTRLLAPLGAAATSTLPEQTILHPVATGHNRRGDGPLTADDTWSFARASGPLGGVCASAADVLAFAELHLADGRAPGGSELLAPALARAMRARRLEAPPLSRPSARGLGFALYDWSGATLAGHDGETLGQVAALRIVPEHELAVTVLTNAIPDGDEVCAALLTAVLGEWSLRPPRMPVPVTDPDFDPRPYEGRYRNLEGETEVAGDGTGLRAVARTTADGLAPDSDVTRLVPVGDGAFVDADAAAPTRTVRFGDPGGDGRCRSVFTGRIAWRTE